MKKIITTLFLVLAIIVNAQHPASSYTISGSTLTEWKGTETGTINMRTTIALRDLTGIGTNAFKNTRASKVVIGDKVSNIHPYAFYYARTISILEVANNNQLHYRTIDGILYTKDGKTLHTYPYAKVAQLNGVVDNLPDSIEVIGGHSMRGILTMTKVVLPESVTTIEERALGNNSSLTSVKLGKNVTLLNLAFQTSANIRELICEATTPPVLQGRVFGHPTDATIDDAFFDECILYVPAASIELYSDVETGGDWSKFKKIEPIVPTNIDNNVGTIKKYFSISVLRNYVSISNTDVQNNVFQIYSISGQLMQNVVIPKESTTEIILPKGLYIIKSNKQVEKILIF